jgi:hypothetical protein
MGLEILYGVGAAPLLMALVWGANRYRNRGQGERDWDGLARASETLRFRCAPSSPSNCGVYPVLANNPKPVNAIRRQAKDSATTRIIRYRILMKVLSGSLRGALTRC